MPAVTIDGKQVTVPHGTPILRAAAMAGVSIPHFCYHPALSAPANCRMCLVEVEKARKLEPSCYLKCTEGMVVHTGSEKVLAARRAVLEFILVNHPVDCPICDQAGECKLQDYYMAYDARPSRLTTQKVGKAKAYPIGPHVVYDGERCILCTRCVRFCDEITGTSELTVIERGDRSEIRTFPGRELDNAYSMCVTDICPVGALTTRDFRFKCRVWLMTSTDSVCTGCAKGCNVHMDHFRGEVQRYRPRFNPEVNEYWMCDEGRLSYRRLHAERSTHTRVGERSEDAWPRAARALAERIKVAAIEPQRAAFVVSAHMSLESLLAAKRFVDAVWPGATVYMSADPDGEGDAFLRRADRNPNRAGVRAVFGDDTVELGLDALVTALEQGRHDALWLCGTAHAESGARVAALAGGLRLVVAQAPHTQALDAVAHAALPAATHAEQAGTFVNCDGLAQPFEHAVPAAGQAQPDHAIFAAVARALGIPLGYGGLDDLRAALLEADDSSEVAS